MSDQCDFCGQFSSYASEKTVYFRGLDKRGEIERIEIGSTDVFIGECCGLDLIESDEIHWEERSYQSYLNGVGDDDIRYVMLVEESVPTREVEIASTDRESTTTMETNGVVQRPILGRRLPETVREHVIGKIE